MVLFNEQSSFDILCGKISGKYASFVKVIFALKKQIIFSLMTITDVLL
jgi:hypothetical protein